MIDLIGRLLGIPLGVAAAVAVAVYVARRALAIAVQQAATLEIERRRGEFAKELEEKRIAAARDLEGFKAQLSLDAEVRRQIASRKVEALVALLHAADRVEYASANEGVIGGGQWDGATIMEGCDFCEFVRKHSFLFEESVAARLNEFALRMTDNVTTWKEKGGAEAWPRQKEARDDLLAAIRVELGVTAPGRT